MQASELHIQEEKKKHALDVVHTSVTAHEMNIHAPRKKKKEKKDEILQVGFEPTTFSLGRRSSIH